MDESKLFAFAYGDFMVIAAEGKALSLSNTIRKYRQSGKFKIEADFSRLLSKSFSEYSLIANIYGERFCSLTAYQNRFNKFTSLINHGIKPLSLEFLLDFASVIELNPKIPSVELIEKTLISETPLRLHYQEICQLQGEKIAGRKLSDLLRTEQDKYRSEVQ